MPAIRAAVLVAEILVAVIVSPLPENRSVGKGRACEAPTGRRLVKADQHVPEAVWDLQPVQICAVDADLLPPRRAALRRGRAEVDRGGSGRPATSSRSYEPSGRSEEHTSELQSLMRISYAVFCLKKKNDIVR